MEIFTAELVGTAILILLGDGVVAATLLNQSKAQNGGWIVITWGWGLGVMVAVLAVGQFSGAHLNPAVTIGLAIAKRFQWKGVLPYVGTQIVAASAAGAVLFAIAKGKPGFSAVESGFASNGYGDRSPGGYGLVAGLIIEIVITAIFVYIILGATDDRAPKGLAPIAIGLGLTVVILVAIPVTNSSVNPARSLGVAWFAGAAALSQMWLFIVAPITGAAIAGASYTLVTGAPSAAVGIAQNPELESHEQTANPSG